MAGFIRWLRRLRLRFWRHVLVRVTAKAKKVDAAYDQKEKAKR